MPSHDPPQTPHVHLPHRLEKSMFLPWAIICCLLTCRETIESICISKKQVNQKYNTPVSAELN